MTDAPADGAARPALPRRSTTSLEPLTVADAASRLAPPPAELLLRVKDGLVKDGFVGDRLVSDGVLEVRDRSAELNA
jgi:hypothetical protein